MQTIELNPYQYSETNITGVRMVDPDENYVIELAGLLERDRAQEGKTREESEYIAAWKLKVETALMVDAVTLFASALSELEMAKQFNIRPLYCNTTDNWEHGYSVINFMKTVSKFLTRMRSRLFKTLKRYISSVYKDILKILFLLNL